MFGAWICFCYLWVVSLPIENYNKNKQYWNEMVGFMRHYLICVIHSAHIQHIVAFKWLLNKCYFDQGLKHLLAKKMECVSGIESWSLAYGSFETVVLFYFEIFQKYIDLSQIIDLIMIYEFTKVILCSFSNIANAPTTWCWLIICVFCLIEHTFNHWVV